MMCGGLWLSSVASVGAAAAGIDLQHTSECRNESETAVELRYPISHANRWALWHFGVLRIYEFTVDVCTVHEYSTVWNGMEEAARSQSHSNATDRHTSTNSCAL